jgi:mRNA-degrading endonuclease RelE of RelBE toxin-antitoxin system
VKVSYAKALARDLEAISHNSGVKKRLSKLIETLKAVDRLDAIQHLKKIEGYDCYYRLRVGDFCFFLYLNTLQTKATQ